LILISPSPPVRKQSLRRSLPRLSQDCFLSSLSLLDGIVTIRVSKELDRFHQFPRRNKVSSPLSSSVLLLTPSIDRLRRLFFLYKFALTMAQMEVRSYFVMSYFFPLFLAGHFLRLLIGSFYMLPGFRPVFCLLTPPSIVNPCLYHPNVWDPVPPFCRINFPSSVDRLIFPPLYHTRKSGRCVLPPPYLENDFLKRRTLKDRAPLCSSRGLCLQFTISILPLSIIAFRDSRHFSEFESNPSQICPFFPPPPCAKACGGIHLPFLFPLFSYFSFYTRERTTRIRVLPFTASWTEK